MTLIEFINEYRNNEDLTIKEMTKMFNELQIADRKDFLSELEEVEREEFIEDIRQQAVDDFWVHERQAILEGKCTRDWTPEQIEQIMELTPKKEK